MPAVREDERLCGKCCHFKFEDVQGWGICPFLDYPVGGPMHCSDLCTAGRFASEKEKRHHLAMLRKCQRCLSGNIGTKQDLDVRAIGDAIDFIVGYSKIH